MLLSHSYRIAPGHGMNYRKRVFLGFRLWRNHARLTSGTSWRAHMVMAMKLMEIPPSVGGDVVECGCWEGGSTVNLSIICAALGRKLRVYDSFEGLPPPEEGDPIAQKTFRGGFIPGVFGGTLEQVKSNVEKYGDISVCSFHPGWFKDSLPNHEGDIVMAFLDVDFYASLNDCLLNLWPHIVEGGVVFLDEYHNLPYCAVFFSEKFWDKNFSCAPPGLIGTGTGVQVGMNYYNPQVRMKAHQLQCAESISYSVKGTRALWDFYPDEAGESQAEAAASS